MIVGNHTSTGTGLPVTSPVIWTSRAMNTPATTQTTNVADINTISSCDMNVSPLPDCRSRDGLGVVGTRKRRGTGYGHSSMGKGMRKLLGGGRLLSLR